jgi:uncharacterized protein (TIGR03435 family)
MMQRLVFILVSAASYAIAQAPRAFEAASIKPHQGRMPRIGVYTAGDRVDAVYTISGFIMYAYDLANYQIDATLALNVTGDTFYDIVAKADGEGAPTPAEFKKMMQGLLADRFKLKFHYEQREMPVYELVIGKNGLRLKDAAADASPIRYSRVNGRNYDITQGRASMKDLVESVANSFPGRPVIDKTGLTGIYDLKLTFTPSTPNNRGAESEPGYISIFTAVQEQLGLKLEARKATVEVLVVDHIEKPSEN